MKSFSNLEERSKRGRFVDNERSENDGSQQWLNSLVGWHPRP